MIIKLRYPPPENWLNAKCKNVPLSENYDPFYGVEYDSEGLPLDEDESKAHAVDFCNGTFDNTVCPIRHECLLFALTNNAKDGVWGGCDEQARKAIRKKWPARKDGTPNKYWHWLPKDEALRGLKKEDIEKEDAEHEEEDGTDSE